MPRDAQGNDATFASDAAAAGFDATVAAFL